MATDEKLNRSRHHQACELRLARSGNGKSRRLRFAIFGGFNRLLALASLANIWRYSNVGLKMRVNFQLPLAVFSAPNFD